MHCAQEACPTTLPLHATLSPRSVTCRPCTAPRSGLYVTHCRALLARRCHLALISEAFSQRWLWPRPVSGRMLLSLLLAYNTYSVKSKRHLSLLTNIGLVLGALNRLHSSGKSDFPPLQLIPGLGMFYRILFDIFWDSAAQKIQPMGGN